jgi:hypothetical protein
MTDHLTPGPEARARIQKFSLKDLQAFLEEVPAERMRALTSSLPSVDGFRRGSRAGISKQREVLAWRLRTPGANEADYKALYLVWRAWIDETQPSAPLIQELIDELEEAAHNADGPDARRVLIEERTNSLLQKLKEQSEENRSSRESIQRLYNFSPLPTTTAAHDIISAAKPAADVDRDATYRNLPLRLSEDEREIQSIKSQLKIVMDRVGAIADQSAKAVRDLAGLRDAVREARSLADATRVMVHEHAKAKSAHDREDNGAAAEARVKALANDIGKLRESVSQLASLSDGLRHVAFTAQKLGETQGEFADQQKQHASRLDQFAAAIEQIRLDVDALLAERTQADSIAALTEQMADLARQIDTVAGRPHPLHQIREVLQHPASVSPALRCTLLPAAGNAAAISSRGNLVAAFADALRRLGMRNTAAQLLAEECTAAVAARQAIFLQGAFASRVARSLAAATGGPAAARLPMPIGLQDGVPLRLAIEEGFSSLEDAVGGLAIEGFNHVPLDLTREIISDCVGPVTLPSTPYRRIAVFATLSQGVAALPIEPEALELGPVFDLDYLDWRTSPGTEASLPQSSFLAAKTDQALLGEVAGAGANTEEAVQLAQALTHKRNPALERTLVRAYQALHLVRSEENSVTPLHSLLYGWLLPYWRALGLSRESVDSAIHGGKIHGGPADARLTAIVATEFPDDEKNGAP